MHKTGWCKNMCTTFRWVNIFNGRDFTNLKGGKMFGSNKCENKERWGLFPFKGGGMIIQIGGQAL